MLGFIIFSLLSSIVYIINDIKDIEKDRKHPIKKNRPIANGSVSIRKAIIIAVMLLVIITFVYIFIYTKCSNVKLSIIFLLIYLILNIAYSFELKNKPIIDIIILASGFVLRILYGGAIIDVEISSWLYLTIFSGSFYLGLGKRRNEYKRYQDKNTRNVLKFYSKDFLDKNLYMCMALTICFYALWAKEFESKLMLWTVPIVMIMAMRYSLNIEKDESEGDPTEIILKDKILIVLGILYLILVFMYIYFLK